MPAVEVIACLDLGHTAMLCNRPIKKALHASARMKGCTQLT